MNVVREIPSPKSSPYQVGGALPCNAPSYVHRRADDDLYRALIVGEFCYVFNSRQMGKSSLQVRTMYRLQQSGVRCATLDLATLGTQDLTAEQWYASIIHTLVQEFDLSLNFRAWWADHQMLSRIQRINAFFETILLPQVDGSIVIFIDEVDSVLGLAFPFDDFFALIRGCYNKRTQSAGYQRLTFALFGVTTPSHLIADKRKTPFNVGKAISLDGIIYQESGALIAGFTGIVANPAQILQNILDWTGGQPFLTQKLCHLVLKVAKSHQTHESYLHEMDHASIQALVQAHILENWENQDEPEHLRTVRDRLLYDEIEAVRLLDLYQQLLSSEEPIPADNSAEHIELQLSGLVVNKMGYLSIRNSIYRAVFSQAWVEAQLLRLRPYYTAMQQWFTSHCQDQNALLQGQVLQDAQVWATGKNLSSRDYQFLAASAAHAYQSMQQLLQTNKVIFRAANQKSNLLLKQYPTPKQRIAHVEMLLPNYQISEELYVSKQTLVYRGWRKTDYSPVIIKLPSGNIPRHSDLMRLRRQFTLTQSLNHAGIVRHIGLESYQNSYALIGTDFGGVTLKIWLESQKPHGLGQNFVDLTQGLNIAIALCDILQTLSEHNIIHNQINPNNILIQPETYQIQLIGFGRAIQSFNLVQPLQNRSDEQEDLVYFAPEQTGYLNRSSDLRSDFYGLGITLFELLTGELPFVANDSRAILKFHHTQSLPQVHHYCPIVPRIISRLVCKLIATNPEDRYQSTEGLKYDLNRCLFTIKNYKNSDDFVLGEQDWTDQFLIPEKYYGRESEIKSLTETFDRITKGALEIVTISGVSGIGKTAIVDELKNTIIHENIYFIKGKFDPLQREIPFSGFVQSFRDLIQQILNENQEKREYFCEKIKEKLGKNAQAIIEIIPELSYLIGPQMPVSELCGPEAHQRFQILFQRFIQVFATSEHPLIIFLDDLQWIDFDSLQLLKHIGVGQHSYLLFVGTYRENEIYENHPLPTVLDDIDKADVSVQKIWLEPLSEQSLNQLISDVLHCKLELAYPLTKLIFQKIQGNPFFCKQVLRSLYENKYIWFEIDTKSWKYDLKKIGEIILTDDVVSFLGQQLKKLPIQTQNILKLAACLGNQFKLSTLLTIAQQSESQTKTDLLKALQAGFLLSQNQGQQLYLDLSSKLDIPHKTYHSINEFTNPESSHFGFLHDRVQQAAYDLIPKNQRPTQHLRIGRLLLSQFIEDSQAISLFDVVNQLNRGISLICEPSEQITLAQLNLDAADKAKTSTAYQAALIYAQTGLDLLPSDRWNSQYKICLKLYNLAAESAFLSGNFEQIFNYVKPVLMNAKNSLDLVPIYETQIQFFTIQKSYQEAINLGLKLVRRLGMNVPYNPSRLRVFYELVKTQLIIFFYPKNVTDKSYLLPSKIAAFRILNLLFYPTYFVSKSLLAVIGLIGVQESIKLGNSIWSSRSYAIYSMIFADLKDFEKSYEMGQLSLQLVKKIPNPQIDAKVKFAVAFFSQPCKRPLAESIPLLRSAMQSAVESGDAIFLGLCYFGECTIRFNLGEPLKTLLPDVAHYSEAISNLKDESSQLMIQVLHRVILKLSDPADKTCTLFGSELKDNTLIQQATANQEIAVLSAIYGYKQYLALLFRDWPSALIFAEACKQYEKGNSASYAAVNIAYIEGLVRLAVYSQCSPREQRKSLHRITRIQKNLIKRSRISPNGIELFCALLQAERHRVFGEWHAAIPLYDKAIDIAKSQNVLHVEAYAHELTGQFYLQWGKDRIAEVYIQSAYDCWGRWGAKAKVADLQSRFPNMLDTTKFSLNSSSE